MTLLRVSDVSKEDDSGLTLRHVSFSQSTFQHIAIAGETGSGKSTLLKIIAGLEQADSGEVIFEDIRVEGPQEKLVPGHEGIAYLSQQFELPRFLRVEQVLRYANGLTDEEADNLYRLCQIDHLLKRNTNQLSGGERQRIALAKLLITSPRLLLLDEPFSNMDMIHKNVLKNIIQDVSLELGITCILVSHDPADILSWAEEVLIMKEGRVIQRGSPTGLYAQPANEYVAGLLGKYNLIDQELAKHIAGMAELILPGKKLFVRPENILISRKENNYNEIVSRVSFLGSYYEIEVTIAGQTIIARTNDSTIKVGDAVTISVPASHTFHTFS